VETYDRIAAESPCPIVVITGDDDADRIRTLLARGARGYLVKGEVEGAALIRLIREVVEEADSSR
jgi:DNA-binding NarL/FixJ family response regulator